MHLRAHGGRVAQRADQLGRERAVGLVHHHQPDARVTRRPTGAARQDQGEDDRQDQEKQPFGLPLKRSQGVFPDNGKNFSASLAPSRWTSPRAVEDQHRQPQTGPRPCTSSAATGAQNRPSPPPSARMVKPSSPQALGVILLTSLEPGRQVVQVEEAAAQDAEDQHDRRARSWRPARASWPGR